MKTPFALALLCLVLPACHDVAAAERWEYRVLYESEFAGIDSFQAGLEALAGAFSDPVAASAKQRTILETELNALGDEGWEWVGSLEQSVVFKRRAR